MLFNFNGLKNPAREGSREGACSPLTRKKYVLKATTRKIEQIEP